MMIQSTNLFIPRALDDRDLQTYSNHGFAVQQGERPDFVP